jgi:transposase-like protein
MKFLDFTSIIELVTYFSTEERCIRYMEAFRWGSMVISPFDPASKVYKCTGNKYKCKNTGKYFNVKTGTFMECAKVPLQKWFVAMFCLITDRKGISSYQLAKIVKVTPQTAWFMLQRIREQLGHETFSPELEGIIEMDETFVGGANKNRHKDKKVGQCHGRSFKDKTPVIGMLRRGEHYFIEHPHKIIPSKIVREKIILRTSMVVCKKVIDTKAHSLQPVIHLQIKHGSNIMTDEWSGYKGLSMYYKHDFVDHSRKQYAKGDITTNRIEGVWSHAKRAIMGVYHHISPKHMNRYFNEIAFRYNTRNMKISVIFEMIFNNFGGRLRYKDLIDNP